MPDRAVLDKDPASPPPDFTGFDHGAPVHRRPGAPAGWRDPRDRPRAPRRTAAIIAAPMAISRKDLINGWIAATLAASIVAWLDGGFTMRATALAPARIWHGEVWRLMTWVFVELGPMSLVVTCAAIYKFGGELAPRWGTRRLVRFVIEVVLAAAITTALVALVSTRAWWMMRCGGWVIPDALLIAWARQYPTSTLVVYGMLALRGRDLVRITIAVVVLYAIAAGPTAMLPELVATAIAALYPERRLASL